MMKTFDRHELFQSHYVEPRTVEVWIPERCSREVKRCYPVIYMHDGQNVFDPVTSYSGEHWGIAEVMSQLIDEGTVQGAIVVAIWHTENRGIEYLPKRRKDSQDDLPNALALALPNHYHRSPISLYGVCEYPEVFSGAACLSTHWPAQDGITLEYVKHALPLPGQHRFYFDYGSATLDGHYGPYQKNMDQIMLDKGYQHGTDWLTRYCPGAEHSEKSWRARVAIPLEFLLGLENVTTVSSLPNEHHRISHGE